MPPGRRPQQLPSHHEGAATARFPAEQLAGLWAPPLLLSDLDAAPVTDAARIRLPA